MNLNQTILNECREEVAKEYNCDRWKEFTTRHSDINIAQERAITLALSRQAEFFRHLSATEWALVDSDFEGEPIYEAPFSPQLTELDLYNIWREATTRQ